MSRRVYSIVVLLLPLVVLVAAASARARTRAGAGARLGRLGDDELRCELREALLVVGAGAARLGRTRQHLAQAVEQARLVVLRVLCRGVEAWQALDLALGGGGEAQRVRRDARVGELLGERGEQAAVVADGARGAAEGEVVLGRVAALALLVDLAAGLAQLLDLVADVLWCSVCACMRNADLRMGARGAGR